MVLFPSTYMKTGFLCCSINNRRFLNSNDTEKGVKLLIILFYFTGRYNKVEYHYSLFDEVFEFSALIMVVGAQLNILNDNLKNIKEDAEIEFEASHKKSYKNKLHIFDEIMNRKLLECVHHHRLIIK